MVDLHPIEKAYTISEYLAGRTRARCAMNFINDLWHIQTLTDRGVLLKLESLGLELSLDELYAVLDKLPKE